MKFVAIGYPYARQNYRAALTSLDAFFILPGIWSIKKGKAAYHTRPDARTITTPAYFYHSDYLFVGGILKGLMPFLPWHLWKLRRRGVCLVLEAHEPTLLSTLYHGICAKLLGFKRVVFSWENIPYTRKHVGIKGVIHRAILSANLILSDGVVCGNEKCLAIFRELTHKPLVRMPLAGLDPSTFRLPEAGRPVNEDITFLFAGALDYRKGIHTLLDAFGRLIDVVPHVRLVLVGSGSDEVGIERHISQLKLPVTRYPWLEHTRLIELMTRSDVFLYPSISYNGWEEQFGYSIAEASLMELPVISTHTGSIEEVVKDGETGVLVAPQDVGQLYEAMRLLALDRAKRIALGTAGRAYIAATYSNEVIAEGYRNFIAGLTTNK